MSLGSHVAWRGVRRGMLSCQTTGHQRLLVLSLLLTIVSGESANLTGASVCYSKYLNRYFSVGQRWREHECTRAECVVSRITGRPTAYVVGCRDIEASQLRAGCVVEQSTNEAWPRCCPRIVCDDNSTGSSGVSNAGSQNAQAIHNQPVRRHQSSDVSQSVGNLLLQLVNKRRACADNECRQLSLSPSSAAAPVSSIGRSRLSRNKSSDQIHQSSLQTIPDPALVSLLRRVSNPPTVIGRTNDGTRLTCTNLGCVGRILETIARDARGCRDGQCSRPSRFPANECTDEQPGCKRQQVFDQACVGRACIARLLFQLTQTNGSLIAKHPEETDVKDESKQLVAASVLHQQLSGVNNEKIEDNTARIQSVISSTSDSKVVNVQQRRPQLGGNKESSTIRSLAAGAARFHFALSTRRTSGVFVSESTTTAESAFQAVTTTETTTTSITTTPRTANTVSEDISTIGLTSSTTTGAAFRFTTTARPPRSSPVAGWISTLSTERTPANSRANLRPTKSSSLARGRRLFSSPSSCAHNNGGCSHQCEQLRGDRTQCKCPLDMKLQDNGFLCVPSSKIAAAEIGNSAGSHGNSSEDEADPLLLFSTREALFLMQLDGSGLETVATQLGNAVGLDYDLRRRCIYWSVVRDISTINRKCDYREPEVLYSGEGVPDKLAVDWTTGNIYWTDGKLSSIQVMDEKGTHRRTLIGKAHLSQPRDIRHLPELGRMYYTDWGETAFIGTAGMDGSDARVIVSGQLEWPNALTISRSTRQLFWADAKLGRVEVSDLGGRRRRVLLESPTTPPLIRPLQHIFALAVFQRRLFWSSWETGAIVAYNGSHALTLRKTHSLPMSMHVLHSSFQRPLKRGNPCRLLGCQQLCLLVPADGGGGPVASCSCSDNWQPTSGNSSTCEHVAPRVTCGRHEFECRADHTCASLNRLCDAQVDCSDASDEPESCPPFNCSPGEFQCRTGQCIPRSQLCDRTPNCLDGGDEVHCPSSV